MRLKKHNLSGFTLIELLIAMVIVGIMSAAVIPFMQRMQIGYERKRFITNINALTQVAWQQAIIAGTVHRILFNLSERRATVERDITKSPLASKLDFEPITIEGSSMSWPASIEIRQFIIAGFDEMKAFGGRAIKTVWFYLIPEGMTQAVTINGVDKDEEVDNKPKPFGLGLNPFRAQFKVYDAFQQ